MDTKTPEVTQVWGSSEDEALNQSKDKEKRYLEAPHPQRSLVYSRNSDSNSLIFHFELK